MMAAVPACADDSPCRPCDRPRALLVRRLSTLACDLSLLVPIHRCKAAIFFCHGSSSHSLCSQILGLQPMCHGNL
jgi:hypothetical protein